MTARTLAARLVLLDARLTNSVLCREGVSPVLHGPATGVYQLRR